MWQAGDVVLKRSIYGGNVRWTFPHRYVGEWNGRFGIYCGPGNQGKAMRRGPEGYLQRWRSDAPPFETEWEQTHVLRFERPGARHSIEIYGIWTQSEAAEIRAEGERVLAEAPWPTGWEDWRPPTAWTPLGLPRDWHVV